MRTSSPPGKQPNSDPSLRSADQLEVCPSTQRGQRWSARTKKILTVSVLYILALGAAVTLLAMLWPSSNGPARDSAEAIGADTERLAKSTKITDCSLTSSGDARAIVEVTSPFQDKKIFVGVEVFFSDGTAVVGSADAEFQNLDAAEVVTGTAAASNVSADPTAFSCEVVGVVFF